MSWFILSDLFKFLPNQHLLSQQSTLFFKNAIILVNEVRSNFSIAGIVIKSSNPTVGDVAYYLNSRDDIRAVDRCVDATRRAISSCDSNPVAGDAKAARKHERNGARF